jgi:hypothetical protein
MTRNLLLSLLLAFVAIPLSAQDLTGTKNADKAIILFLGYGPISSAGDLTERFGNGFSIDGGLTLMSRGSSLEFGFRAQFGFGTDVKQDILANLRTTEGFLIGNQREPADINLRQRQLFLGPTVGYTFKIGKNERAGLHVKTTVGYYYHRIKIQRDVVQGVSQLNEEYLPGYDRLAGGLGIHQFVGYQQLAANGTLNFYVGAEVLAGFTKNLRIFDIPTGLPPSTEGRLDMVLGLKAGIILPFYVGEGRQIFYK